MKKRIIILGSTGSVGTQALEVIQQNQDKFEVVGLSANKNEALLNEQAKEFGALHAVLAHDQTAPLIELVKNVEADLVLVAVIGEAGVEPTLAAIEAGKEIALANKETLVMEGEKVMQVASENSTQIIPVDSEHSAIFQCLQVAKKEGLKDEIERIILTCSGGPFYKKTQEELKNVTAEDALKHPTWDMGARVTIDSATWVNKGLEIIEAHHLFGFDYDHIDVLIHPESRIHGMVQLKDGTYIAHEAPPDMKIPIEYALNYPEEVELDQKIHHVENLAELGENLTFDVPPDGPLLGIQLGYKAGRSGQAACQRLVRKNSAAQTAFLNGEIFFLEIYDYSRLR